MPLFTPRPCVAAAKEPLIPAGKHQIVNWLLDCEHIFTEQRDHLTALDTDIGDGDHGLNMQRGFTKVAEKPPAVADKDIGQVLKTTGMTLLSRSVRRQRPPVMAPSSGRRPAAMPARARPSASLGKMLGDGVGGDRLPRSRRTR